MCVAVNSLFNVYIAYPTRSMRLYEETLCDIYFWDTVDGYSHGWTYNCCISRRILRPPSAIYNSWLILCFDISDRIGHTVEWTTPSVGRLVEEVTSTDCQTDDIITSLIAIGNVGAYLNGETPAPSAALATMVMVLQIATVRSVGVRLPWTR